MSTDEFEGMDEEEIAVIRGILREELAEFKHEELQQHSMVEITPREALEEYLTDLARECAEATVETNRSRLQFFVDWCEGKDREHSDEPRVESLSELDGQYIRDFRDWRRERSGWAVTTEESNMKTLRKFLRECENPNWVPQGVAESVPVPTVDPNKESRDLTLHRDKVEDILAHLKRFEYATLPHCVWVVLWETGCRISGLRALDISDYERDHTEDGAVLQFRNRPDTGTRLKNGRQSERDVKLSEQAAVVIDDYIDNRRSHVTDDAGRKSLFTTRCGRLSSTTVRKYVYVWSRPCMVGNPCPFDRDEKNCEAMESKDTASRCPDSVSPHPIRRGRLSDVLNQGMIPQLMAEKYDVSADVLRQHYDTRSHKERQEVSTLWASLAEKFFSEEYDPF